MSDRSHSGRLGMSAKLARFGVGFGCGIGFVAALVLLGQAHGWNWHRVYVTMITWGYVFWNTVRIFTYVPTLRMLLKIDASAQHYSLTTWGSWVLSNGTLALYLFENSQHRVNALVLLNSGNAVMCLLTCVLILRLRHRERGAALPKRSVVRKEPAQIVSIRPELRMHRRCARPPK